MKLSVGGTTLHLTRGRVVVLLFAFALFGFGGYDYAEQREAVGEAEAVDAVVLNSTVVEDTAGRGIDYDPRVEYRYSYGGTTYTGDDFFPGSITPSYDTEKEALSVVEGYDEGETVTAYVDPDRPGGAFLERRATNAPLAMAGAGFFVAVVVLLHAAGAQKPGRGNELVPVDAAGPDRYSTIAGVQLDAVHRYSKRGIAVSSVAFFLSLTAFTVALLATTGLADVTVQADPLGPVGAPLVAAFVAYTALVASVFAYGVWSFTEYRHLRDRIDGETPPSPFRHPTRLVTIALTNNGLDKYGERVKYTAVAFVFFGFLSFVLVSILFL